LLSSWVVLGHQSAEGGLISSLLHVPFLHILAKGTLAVSGFFCLSGFILAYNYSTRLGSLDEVARFIGARLARIYPVYLLGLLVFLPYAIYHWHEGIYSAGVSIGALILCLGLVQTLVVPFCGVWNLPGWSLSAELFFYLTLPIYAARLKNLSNRVLSMALGASLLASLGAWLLAEHWQAGIFVIYSPVFRVPEFIAGYITGLFFLRHGAWSKSLSAVALILATVVVVGGCNILPGGNYFGVFPIFFLLLIYALVNPPRWVGLLLGNPGAVWLGEISYGMYIFHEPASFYFKSFEKYVSRTDLWHQHPYVAMGFYFLTVVSVSGLVFVFVERPLRKRLAPVLAARIRRIFSGVRMTHLTGENK